MELFKLLSSDIAEMQAKVTVYCFDLLKNKVIYEKDSDAIYSSASIIKVPILLTALHLVQQGELKLSDTFSLSQHNSVEFSRITENPDKAYKLDELLFWMITESDNSATNVIIDTLTMDRVNAFIKKAELSHTVLARKMMDFEARQAGRDNLTTARDIAMLYKKLYNCELLNSLYTEKAFYYLKKQRQKDGLLRYIPDNFECANKSGSLDKLNNDTGIFWLPNGRVYAVGIFISEVSDNETGLRYIGKISEIIYKYTSR